MKSTKIKNLEIEEGLTISVDAYSIHYDAEVWGPVDPYQFYPQRFSPEFKRAPAAYMSFGLGPRNCIGMKFAILEIKIALVKILMNFEISVGPSTPENLEITEGIVRRPLNGINVCIRKRKII